MPVRYYLRYYDTGFMRGPYYTREAAELEARYTLRLGFLVSIVED